MKRNTKNNITVTSLILILIILTVFLLKNYILKDDFTNEYEDKLAIFFMDSGQSDCILVKTPEGKNILIDAGDNGDENKIINSLNNLNVKDIEYAVFTHPHADHIGGAAEIINEYKIKNAIIPNKVHTTKTYTDMLEALDKNDVNVKTALSGEAYNISDDLNFKILSPIKEDYGDNLNLYSVVILLEYKNNKFLFTGDAEAENEAEMLEASLLEKVDLLKVGHHGSSSSSSKEFIELLSPKYSIILCGKDNSYGHPHKETLETLNEIGSKIYRTDLNGMITVISDGSSIEIKTEK